MRFTFGRSRSNATKEIEDIDDCYERYNLSPDEADGDPIYDRRRNKSKAKYVIPDASLDSNEKAAIARRKAKVAAKHSEFMKNDSVFDEVVAKGRKDRERYRASNRVALQGKKDSSIVAESPLPTAASYLSDDSYDQLAEERSLASRYSNVTSGEEDQRDASIPAVIYSDDEQDVKSHLKGVKGVESAIADTSEDEEGVLERQLQKQKKKHQKMHKTNDSLSSRSSRRKDPVELQRYEAGSPTPEEVTGPSDNELTTDYEDEQVTDEEDECMMQSQEVLLHPDPIMYRHGGEKKHKKKHKKSSSKSKKKKEKKHKSSKKKKKHSHHSRRKDPDSSDPYDTDYVAGEVTEDEAETKVTQSTRVTQFSAQSAKITAHDIGLNVPFSKERTATTAPIAKKKQTANSGKAEERPTRKTAPARNNSGFGNAFSRMFRHNNSGTSVSLPAAATKAPVAVSKVDAPFVQTVVSESSFASSNSSSTKRSSNSSVKKSTKLPPKTSTKLLAEKTLLKTTIPEENDIQPAPSRGDVGLTSECATETPSPVPEERMKDINQECKEVKKETTLLDPIEMDRMNSILPQNKTDNTDDDKSKQPARRTVLPRPEGAAVAKTEPSKAMEEEEHPVVKKNDTKELSIQNSKSKSRGGNLEMMELDEYSETEDQAQQSALAQCLKFYYCGAAAKLVDWNSPRPKLESGKKPKGVQIDDVVMAQRIKDTDNFIRPASPGSPGPKFEVVLEEGEIPLSLEDNQDDENATRQSGSILEIVQERTRKNRELHLDEDDDDEDDNALCEAPDLASLGRSNSVVMDVSHMSLALDDFDSDDENDEEWMDNNAAAYFNSPSPRSHRKDTTRKRNKQVNQKKKKKNRKNKSRSLESDDEETVISVTSIEIPTAATEDASTAVFTADTSKDDDFNDLEDDEVSKENSSVKDVDSKRGAGIRRGWLSRGRSGNGANSNTKIKVNGFAGQGVDENGRVWERDESISKKKRPARSFFARKRSSTMAAF